jgi:hypothetical protein
MQTLDFHFLASNIAGILYVVFNLLTDRRRGIGKLGEHVTVSYEKDKDGKAWATLISVIEPKPKAK